MSIKHTQRFGPANAWAYAVNIFMLLTFMCQKCSLQRVDVPAEVIGKLMLNKNENKNKINSNHVLFKSLIEAQL